MEYIITAELKEATLQILQQIPCGAANGLSANVYQAWRTESHITPLTPEKVAEMHQKFISEKYVPVQE